MKKLIKFYPALIAAFPFVASAAPAAPAMNTGTMSTLLANLSGTLFAIIAFLFVLATLIFLWGMVQYIMSAGDEASRNKSKGIMLWGIIGLAVMVGVWGLTNIILSYFGLGGETVPTGPSTQG